MSIKVATFDVHRTVRFEFETGLIKQILPRLLVPVGLREAPCRNIRPTYALANNMKHMLIFALTASPLLFIA